LASTKTLFFLFIFGSQDFEKFRVD